MKTFVASTGTEWVQGQSLRFIFFYSAFIARAFASSVEMMECEGNDLSRSASLSLSLIDFNKMLNYSTDCLPMTVHTRSIGGDSEWQPHSNPVVGVRYPLRAMAWAFTDRKSLHWSGRGVLWV